MVGKPHTAVFINDHQLITDLLSLVFREHGIGVVGSFTSAEPGVAYMVANPPSLAVVEMILPVMRTLAGEKVEYSHPYVLQDTKRSFQAVRDIRNRCPNTRILMLTGELHPHNFEMGFRAGAHGIASKFDKLSDLLDILRRAWAGETRVLSDRMEVEFDEYLASPAPELTNAEVQILELVQEGLESPEIGRRLRYSARTIRNKLNQIYQKLGARNRFEAVEIAIEMGLVGWRG